MARRSSCLKLTSLVVALFLLDTVRRAVCLGHQATSDGRVISVDPRNGKDDPDCIAGKGACKTLSWAFQVAHRASSTTYLLENGTHILDTETPTFEGPLGSLVFQGNAENSSSVVIQCTEEGTGLAFVGVTGLTFSNLTFYNCSALRNSTTRDYRDYDSTDQEAKFYHFQVGLYFYQCTSVSMTFVTVSDSPNAAGVVMYDTNGTNRIVDSIFQNNVIADNTTATSSPYGGGGGFYVEFTYCVPGDKGCSDSKKTEQTITGAEYTFLRSKFTNNQARGSSADKGTYLVEFKSDHVAFGRGGGLSIFLKGDSYNNNISIIHCDFEGNSAIWGGGLLMEFQDYVANNFLHIVNSSFLNNNSTYNDTSGTGGGGVRLGHCVYHQPNRADLSGNKILIEGSYFTNNTALNGGGLSISVSAQNTTTNHLAQINIDNCIFAFNIARLGSAIHLDSFPLILFGLLADVGIGGTSHFMNNSVRYLVPLGIIEAYPHQIGLGAVYTHGIKVRFRDELVFYKNLGSAVAAAHTMLDFCDSNATFDKNTGNKGGAISLLGGSYLVINESSRMTFLNNMAVVHGGAIYNTYIARENMISYSHCFIRHVNPFLHPDNWGAEFIFEGNVHMCRSRQNSIYSTSILPCAWAGGVGVNADLSAILCWRGWSYTDQWGHVYSNRNCSSQLSTDTGSITMATADRSNKIPAFPGHPFDLEINIVDDLNRDMKDEAVFVANTNYSSESALDVDGDVYSYVWGESTTVWGRDKENIVIALDSVENRVWHLEIVVELQSCPPGFKEQLVPESPSDVNDTDSNSSLGHYQCVCANHYGGVLLCEERNLIAMLKNSNWMGPHPDNSDEYVSSPCPPEYCYSSPDYSHFQLPNKSDSLVELICGSRNRKGILCGECVDHFEPAVNSPTYQCVNCTDVNVVGNIFKYLAIVYIPNILLFIVIILFGVRLTSAPANAFILYSQIISSTFNLDADGQIPLSLVTGRYTDALLKAYRIPYGIFNLELLDRLVPPFCIGTGLDTLAVISLEYAVAFTPLLMILLAVTIMKIVNLISNRCNKDSSERSRMFTASAAFFAKRKRTLSESLLPAFAAFLLLSYNKFSLTSAYIMNHQYFVDENGTIISTSRVYYAGHYTMEDKTYLVHYFIPALVFFILFGLLPPLFLLHYPMRVFEWCLEKVHCLWRFYPATKVHVLLDTFQGCFKIKYRFFAGLYFVFRLVINFNIMLNESWLQQYVVQQAACVIMVMLIAVCQPYNKENDIFNRIDAFIFANLAVINAISLYLYEFSHNNPQLTSLPLTAFAFQYILVYLPFLYIIVYIVWERTTPCHNYWRKLARNKTKSVLGRWNVNSYKRVENTADDSEISSAYPSNFPVPSLAYHGNINDEFEESEEVILRRAEMENTYRPRSRLVTIVEAHGMEGEVSLRHTTSEDSGLRSVQSSPAYYGSTGEMTTGGSSSSARSSLRNSGGGSEARHSSKSYKVSKNNDNEDTDSRRKTS